MVGPRARVGEDCTACSGQLRITGEMFRREKKKKGNSKNPENR